MPLPQDAAVPQDQATNGRLHTSEIWISWLQGERIKDERKQKSALTWRSTHFTPLCQPTLLFPRLWLRRARTSLQQSKRTARSRGLTFPALSYKLVSKPETPFALASQQRHLLKPPRGIQHQPEFHCHTTASPFTAHNSCSPRHEGRLLPQKPLSRHLAAGEGVQS